ncbi:MAG TPA: hypothetical protein VFS45_05415 [Sphingomicrobium sp.]|nr:hypothetical protein [Sphingomicrobium sp.]
MRIIITALLMLGACSPEPEAARDERPAAPAAGQAAPQPRQSSMLMSVPDDPEALKKLVAMGYSVHDDHLHAPGVTSCPKMGEDPVI